MPQKVYAVATMDTKGPELEFVAERLRGCGVEILTVDVGTLGEPQGTPDVRREDVAAHGSFAGSLDKLDRGEAVAAMGRALGQYLLAETAAGNVAGVIGLGGSGGTALIAPALRGLPVGLPKLLVSTVASGNTAPYLGSSDVILVPSVVDVAGMNSVSLRILSNAAAAMAGMVRQDPPPIADRTAIGLTMFGLTTPCVTSVRVALEPRGYDCLVFHATGTGGRAMESLVASGLIRGVIDLTTTEVADMLVGGVFACDSSRFDSILAARIPFVISVGALDMVNFGALETVPEAFRGRKLHVHNPQVTLMRTIPEENRAFGRWIADKLNRSVAPFLVLIPERGISGLDAPGRPFHDPEADVALFEAIETTVQPAPGRTIERLPYHINDPEFAAAVVRGFLGLVGD